MSWLLGEELLATHSRDTGMSAREKWRHMAVTLQDSWREAGDCSIKQAGIKKGVQKLQYIPPLYSDVTFDTKTVILILPRAKIMELAHLEDIHGFFF